MDMGVRRRVADRRKQLTARHRGFTIVETMIVLAVTGALFVAIAATLSGRQNTAEFTHAIQSIQSQLQQTIDQVSTGFYPNQSNFACVNSGGAVQFSAGGTGQGANQGCVFLGKAIQFQVSNTNPEQYRVYTVAGIQGAVTGVTSPFQTSDPTVVGVAGNYADYSTTASLEYGLTTLWVKGGGSNIGAVAFLMEPGALNSASSSGYGSGTQQIDLVPIQGSSLNETLAQGTTAINSALQDPNLTANAPLNPTGGVQICFVSGGTNESGLITIGGSGRQLVVTLAIKGDQTCT